MSLPSSPPLILDVGVRRAETRVAHAAIAAGVLSPWLFELEAAASVVMSALLAFILHRGLRQAGWLRSTRRIVRISWLADGRWMVANAEGRVSECELGHGTRAMPGVVWLQLRSLSSPRRKIYMLLTRCDGFEDPLRRLIVRLRLDGGKPQGPLLPPGLQREGHS